MGDRADKRRAAGVCTRCGAKPPTTNHTRCAPCIAYGRDQHLRVRYNITQEQLETLDTLRSHGCMICKASPIEKSLAIDHDHITGDIRGLLCVPCNTSLGWLERYKKEVNEYLR